MGKGGNLQPSLDAAEHIGADEGENIEAKRVGIYGYDSGAGQWRRVAVDSSGNFSVSASLVKDDLPVAGATQAVAVAIVDSAGDQISSFGGGTQYTEDDTDASITGTALMFESNTGTNALAVVNENTPLPISIQSAPNPVTTVPTDASTNAANIALVNGSSYDNANDGVFVEGGVYEASPGTLSDGQAGYLAITNNHLLRTSTDVVSVIPGTGATSLGKAEDGQHTSGDVGVMALGVRVDTPNATVAANGDYQYVAQDMVGGVRTALYETDFAVLGTNHVKKYYTNAGAVTDGIIWSPAAGKRWYVTDIFIQVSAAATVTLEDDKAGGDEAIWKAELAANSGWSHSFSTPWFSGEDAADLIITTSAGNVYCTVVGYEV